MSQYIAIFGHPPIKAIAVDLGFPNYGHIGNGEYWLEVPADKPLESAVNTLLFLGYVCAATMSLTPAGFDNAYAAWRARARVHKQIAEQYVAEGFI